MPAKLKSDPHLEIAHVLFIDVVGYSKLLVNEQRAVIEELNQVVRKTPQVRKSDAANKLIRIPAGDGMALVFFQTPEEPVQCAMEIAKALKKHPQIEVRMGVHSGPVDQIKDVSGRPNIAGAGINIAQRVMDCGEAGHILISKRIAEDLAQDSLWQPLLHDLGEIEVKHGTKVGLVNLYSSELGNREPPKKIAFSPQPQLVTTATKGESLVPEKSIAVLPFENLSADPENAFFADGVQDEILMNLSKIADLKVISRSSVMQYKTGVKRNLREIASDLGVAHVLEGSVQRAGNRVRVSAQLIDARTDAHLWAEHYHRPLDDVFAIQSEIAKAVADQLQAKLSPAEKAAIEQPATTNLVAYDRYLRARKLMEKTTYDASTPENFRQAVRLLDQAVAHDPSFLVAHCDLVRAHTWQYVLGIDHTESRLTTAKTALDQALRLRPDSGESHLAAAWFSYHAYRDYKTALAELAIARQTLPNDGSIPALTGFIERRQRKWQESAELLERAAELDPHNVWLLEQAALGYALLRRYADVASAFDRALAAPLRQPTSRVGRALVELDSRADTEPANEAIKAVLTDDPSAVDAIADQWLYCALCRRDFAEAARALASIPPEGICPYNVRMSRSFCQGVVARAQGDAPAAASGFIAARDEMAKLVNDQPDYPEGLSILGMIDAALGQKESAFEEGRRAAELAAAKDANTGAEILRNLAITYAWAGEKELALKQLEEVIRIPSPISYGQLRLHPWWDPLRDDPRFERLAVQAKEPVALN
jgi:TolB-like protein/Tfp pilus assembly protein PilF